MKASVGIWLLSLALVAGCVESSHGPKQSLLEEIGHGSLEKHASSFSPLFYRYTESHVDDAKQVILDAQPWLLVSDDNQGHGTIPRDGYHWYAMRLHNPSLESRAAYLAVESTWWTDYAAWEVVGELRDNPSVTTLEPMNVIGIRYPLVLSGGETATILFRYRLKGPSLSRIEHFQSSDRRPIIEEPSVVIGVYVGLMVLMLIYNLGFFILLRERTYLYFSSLILSTGGLILDEFGFFEFAGYSFQENIGALTWVTLCVICCGLTFDRIVFDARSIGRLRKLLHSCLWSTFASGTLLAFTGAFVFYPLTAISHYATGFVLLVISWRGWREREMFMVNLMTAMVPMSFVAAYVPVMRLGLVPALLDYPYFHLLVAVFFQVMLCSILPLRFQKEVVSRELLDQSLEEKEKGFSEINEQVSELVEIFKRLEDEDKFTRAALVSTQESRMDAQRKLRDAHQQLRHLEYHVSLGRLVAGVAHDIGNPATHISGCAQSFRVMIEKLGRGFDFEPGTPLYRRYHALEDACEKLEGESSYIVQVNRALARYGRIDDMVAPGTDIQKVTEQVLCVLASRLRKHEIRCEFGELPELTAKPGQISQLLANLILNAIDAVDSVDVPGRIFVSAHLQSGEEEDGISLTVADNGPGVPPMVRRAGFRPFVTTRNPARWLGIGLSIAKRIVEEHGGKIFFPDIDTAEGGLVKVWLPVGRDHEA